MNKIVELELAEQNLEQAQVKFEAIQQHILKIEQEITLLNHIELQIAENVSILKSRHIITLAVEFKKAREDLNKIRNNLSMLRINREAFSRTLEQTEKFLYEARQKYIELLKGQGTVVIQGKFGRKDDRQGGDTA